MSRAREINRGESADQRKQEIMDRLESLHGKGKDDILSIWHELVAKEAELIYELKAENQILQTIMGAHSLSLAGAAVGTDDTAIDDRSTDNDEDELADDEVVIEL
ncbi:MAG: hypothetical protein AAF413_00685 [Patescibacteria group bacterium]